MAAMHEPNSAPLEFPVGWCAGCGRHVLTHAGLDGEAVDRLCVHCDGRVDAELRAVKEGELDSHGYALIENFDCGSPNCGGGRCGRG
jgi:hypothetical protein